MKIKLLSLLLALLCLLGGCQLALPEDVSNSPVPSDLLIGIYMTPEHLDLFDFESWINDNLNQLGGDIVVEGDTSAYEGRLYATYNEETDRWDFDDLEGHSLFCWERVDETGTCSVMQNTGGLADSHFATKSTDFGTEHDITATLYVQPADLVSWYFNPVYQDAEGNVYLMAGSGSSFSDRTGGVGMSVTQTLSGEISTTDIDGVTKTDKTTCKVTVQTRRPAELVRVVWMDAAHEALRQEDFTPEAMPEELDARDAAYLVVEEQNFDGTVVYTIVQPEDDDGKNVRVYAPGDYGALIAHDIPVVWE